MKTLLLGLLLIASLTVQAQVPTVQVLPNYVVPLEQQAKDAITRLNQATARLKLTQDSLARCRYILDSTRRNDRGLDNDRLARIAAIQAEATQKLTIEADLRRVAEVEAQKARNTTGDLIRRIGIEAATNRFLGRNRRSALLDILQSVQ